jgi:ubiquinone biosynthesis monooxygenase Coq7
MSQKKLPNFLQEMIRVNQAGEFGAKRIYEGMIDYSKPAEKKLLKEMRDQELEHLATFNNIMIKNKVRPTFLQPFWHLGGYAMGAVTAKIHPKIAHACTIAVEEVIEKHYQEQLNELEFYPEYEDFKNTIQQFRKEELEHRDMAMDQGGDHHPLSQPVKSVVTAITKAAIFLSKKI